jgi:hypothetical protein
MLSELLPWNASSTRRGRGRSTGRGAVTDAASSWQAFLASPVAPQRAIMLPELDGYPTAVIVAPSLIQPDALHARQFLVLRLVTRQASIQDYTSGLANK